MTKMIEDLKRSGLTKTDGIKLKLEILTQEQTKKAVNKKQISYRIPYFDIQGKPTNFYRIRFLEPPKGLAGKAKKQQRYSQPKSTGNHLYFPTLTKWQVIAKDVTIPITITEGEKKAAKACKEGIPCIGLGGVWSFRSKTEVQSLIEDFHTIRWEGREVKIIFDSDLTTNPMVMKAMLCLSNELTKLGAYVYNGYVPEVNGAKAGIDDYLVAYSADEFLELPLSEHDAAKALWKLNDELAVIVKPPSIYHLPSQELIFKDAMTGILYANKFHDVIDADGSLKKEQTAPLWLRWECRREHSELIYAPGKDSVLAGNKLNIWKGWGCEPDQGDIAPFYMLLNFLFKDDPKFKEWFLMWLAYPLQNPGAKLYTAVLLTSLTHGMGKSFVGYIMGKIYGVNFKEISHDDVESAQNHWAVCKQFIMADDVTGSDKRKEGDRRNALLTRKSLTVNIKYSPQYDVLDCINYLYTSNHPDAMFVNDKDRRMAIHEIIGDAMTDAQYKTIENWMEAGGPSALFYHLQNEIDCSKFNPHSKAIGSKAKTDMVTLGRSDIDTFVYSILEDPDNVLSFKGIRADRDFFTASELISLYDPDNLKRTSVTALSKALRRAGFCQYVTRTANGTQRLWALRSMAEWVGSKSSDRRVNYDESIAKLDKARTKKFAKEDKKK